MKKGAALPVVDCATRADNHGSLSPGATAVGANLHVAFSRSTRRANIAEKRRRETGGCGGRGASSFSRLAARRQKDRSAAISSTLVDRLRGAGRETRTCISLPRYRYNRRHLFHSANFHGREHGRVLCRVELEVTSFSFSPAPAAAPARSAALSPNFISFPRRSGPLRGSVDIICSEYVMHNRILSSLLRFLPPAPVPSPPFVARCSTTASVEFFFPSPSTSSSDGLDCDVYMILATASLSVEIAPVGIRILRSIDRDARVEDEERGEGEPRLFPKIEHSDRREIYNNRKVTSSAERSIMNTHVFDTCVQIFYAESLNIRIFREIEATTEVSRHWHFYILRCDTCENSHVARGRLIAA